MYGPSVVEAAATRGVYVLLVDPSCQENQPARGRTQLRPRFSSGVRHVRGLTLRTFLPRLCKGRRTLRVMPALPPIGHCLRSAARSELAANNVQSEEAQALLEEYDVL